MPTRAAVSEFEFILDNIIDYEEIIQTSRFKDANAELVSQILIEAGRMCDDVLSPLNRVGDLQPAILSNGVVKTSPGFWGWISRSSSRWLDFYFCIPGVWRNGTTTDINGVC